VIKNVWKDPVWSKVIATGILALIGSVSAYFLDWWPSIKGSVNDSIEFINATTAVSNWLLGIMALCTIAIALVLALMLKDAFLPESQRVNWQDYTSDNFFGLEWHWKYCSGGSIFNLFSCCAKCRYQVFPEDVSSYSAVPRIAYRCDSCGSVAGPFNEADYDIESKVERFIHQKLRTGSWLSNENA
jgi:hypothetical protein